MASSRQITVTINADASPAIRELRRAEVAVKRLKAQVGPTEADRRWWRAFQAGRDFQRVMDRVRVILKVDSDESEPTNG